MNYRHAYHAGNHADVLKHITLCRVLNYMRLKDKPFAGLDTHAGIGVYDLNSVEAGKTGEWQDGIAKLLNAKMTAQEKDLLQSYLSVITSLNNDGALKFYPGSPEIFRHHLRKNDRLFLNELHSQDAATLAARYAKEKSIILSTLDANIAAKAILPFQERRGVVLIDPAFEVKDETARISAMLQHIEQRMATAVVLLWYPIKTIDEADEMRQRMADLKRPGTLIAELMIKQPFAEGGLAGSAMAIFNPPYTLADELRIILPLLAANLGKGNWGRGTVYQVTPPA
jgi:23S rRNA (adenine2030-N6)-methyltransferase